MACLFRCCSRSPPRYDYQDKALKNAYEDLLLFTDLPADSISQFDVAEDQQGISLVRIGKWQRFVNWITRSNSGRLARLVAYTNRARDAVPVHTMSPVQIVEFYKNLTRFTRYGGKTDRILEGQVDRTRTLYQQAVAEFQTAQNEFHRAKMARGVAPPQVEQIVQTIHDKKSEVEHKRWDMLYAETHLADWRGNGFTPAGEGVNGALFGLDLAGERPIMVRKDNEKDERVFNERTLTLGIHRSQEQVCGNDPRQAEAAAFEASDFFDFDVVPPTNTDTQGHSYQVFEPGGMDANNPIANLKGRDPNSFKDNEVEKLQTMALFDYLIGDLDGHDKNWKVIYNNETGEIEKVVKFDNGNSFPEKSLDSMRDRMTLNKTYAWKKHGWAQRSLNPRPGSKLERILNKLRDPQQQIQFWLKIADKYPGFATTNRIELMRERISVIHAAEERKLSMAQLGQIYSSEYLGNLRTLNGALLQTSISEYYRSDGVALNPAVQIPAPVAPIDQAAQRLEANENEAVGALGQRGADPILPKPTVVEQAWNGARWMATPVTAPVSWAWSGVTHFAAKFVPTGAP